MSVSFEGIPPLEHYRSWAQIIKECNVPSASYKDKDAVIHYANGRFITYTKRASWRWQTGPM